MKKTVFYGYVYDFNVDYDATAVDDVLEIHKYLIKKTRYKIMFGFIKNKFIKAIAFIRLNANVVPLQCVSMSNKECKIRAAILNINR